MFSHKETVFIFVILLYLYFIKFYNRNDFCVKVFHNLKSLMFRNVKAAGINAERSTNLSDYMRPSGVTEAVCLNSFY